MPKVIVTAEVEDGVKWEEGFRTHGDLFKSQTVSRIDFAVIEGNQVAVHFEVENLSTFKEILDSPATTEAMTSDGVKRETVKVFVLDKELIP